MHQSSEHRLREALCTESSRADAAESARDAAMREAAEAHSSAAAASASAEQATTTLARVQDELNATKMQFDLAVLFIFQFQVEKQLNFEVL